MIKKKICVVTGSRAEYGLLYWLMKEIQASSDLELQLVVTGSHLSKPFGQTEKVIENDGFKIDERVDILEDDDSAKAIVRAMGRGVLGFGEALSRLAPDLLVVLGDRYEILTAVQAALIFKIPVAHIHGGEITEGAFDDAIRHVITKMSHLHFAAAEPYRKRIMQMGEDPASVLNVGAIGLDNIHNLILLSRTDFEKSVGLTLGKETFLITYHPMTLGNQTPEGAIKELFTALDAFPNAKILFTKSNADTHGKLINKMVDDYCASHSDRAIAHTSLGQLRYLSAVQHCDIVIGNSSSGLIEVPALKKPTVNIGDRQKGRLRANSVIDCTEDHVSIEAAIRHALSKEFQKGLQNIKHPYVDTGHASQKIVETIRKADLAALIRKSFRDL